MARRLPSLACAAGQPNCSMLEVKLEHGAICTTEGAYAVCIPLDHESGKQAQAIIAREDFLLGRPAFGQCEIVTTVVDPNVEIELVE
jgi:hypothetical protein